MKKFLTVTVIFILAATSINSSAQIKAPYDMMINGVKVVVMPSGNEIVVVQTVLKGGVQNYPATKMGIENLALAALTECGTVKDDKNTFKNKLDKISARVDGYTSMDYGAITLNCINSDFENAWPLYVEAITEPRFDPVEFERIRMDAITSLRAMESNPDYSISKMARQTAFNGKNYAKEPSGTVDIVSKLTVDETKNYYKELLTRSRMVIIVVGEVEKESLKKKMENFLAKIPAGSPFKPVKDSYSPTVNTMNPQEKELATNYINGISSAPLATSNDYNAFNLAMRIFRTKYFLEVRSKYGLTYAPGVRFTGGLTPYSEISVTTTEPDKYIAVTRNLIDKVKKDGFTPDELKDIKTAYLTREYYNQETNSAQAAALTFNEVVHNNWKRALSVRDDIKKVSLPELNNSFNKYISNITWSYQGNPSKMNPVLFTQKQTPPMPTDVKKPF